MKSATPKVLHRIGGRTSWGTRSPRPGRSAPSTWPWWSATSATWSPPTSPRSTPAVIADQDEVKGTGRATECGLHVLPPTSPAPCS